MGESSADRARGPLGGCSELEGEVPLAECGPGGAQPEVG